jgi:hypothetical protein
MPGDCVPFAKCANEFADTGKAKGLILEPERKRVRIGRCSSYHIDPKPGELAMGRVNAM